MQQLPSLDRLAVIDVETSGGNPSRDRIIEIGIVLVDGDTISHTWQSLVQPDIHVPESIEKLTGIDQEALRDAPTFGDLHRTIEQLLADRVFVAHNARFDYAFVSQEFLRLDKRLSWSRLCTLRLSKSLFPQERLHNLDALIKRHSLPCPLRHRAGSDALATAHFWLQVKPLAMEQQAVLASLMAKPRQPPKMPENELEKLPSGPGVYVFYSSLGTPLYVGKSINIKERVKQHLADQFRLDSKFDMMGELAAIESFPTAGDLGAQFLETKLIHELTPLYNKQSRKKTDLTYLVPYKNGNGYYRLKWMQGPAELLEEMIHQKPAIFSSKRRAKNKINQAVADYTLCPNLTGLDLSEPCFNYHINSCNGGCILKEPATDYNRRFLEAINPWRITPWPFEGAIGLVEADVFSGNRVLHVIDNWRYLGTLTETNGEVKDAPLPPFDLDEYHLIQRIFNKNGHYRVISPLPR